MTDTTTLAPTDAEIWREWELILATSNPTAGTAAIKLARTAIAKWGAPATASHEALTTALAACRDAFPVPASGSASEFEWQGAMTDPLGVPAYVRACAAPPAQEARVPLTSQECRDILEEVDHYNFAIDLIRAVEKHHGITAQKETP